MWICKHLLIRVSVFCALLTLAPTIRCFAEDLKTLDGKTFQNITISGMDEGRVKLVHDAGLIWIEKANLPPEFVEKHSIPATDPAKLAVERVATDAKQKEMIAAREKKEKEEAKIAAAVRIQGRVMQVIGGGLIIEAKGGGGVYAPWHPLDKDRPKAILGKFYLLNHPKQNSLVDDSYIDVDATPVGVFDYTTVLGAPARVKKYEILKAFK